MKITITESQFKKLLQTVVNESIGGDPVHEQYYEIGEKAKAVIDNLYNEGVVAYDDDHLTAMANDMSKVNFDDIYYQITFEFGLDLSPEELKIIEDRLKTGSNPELDDQVMRAIREYEEKAHEYLNGSRF